MANMITSFLREEEGASAVEYGLVVGLIAVALVVVLGLLGLIVLGASTRRRR